MPASASAAMTALAELRSTHSAVSTVATSIGGWLIWTAMNSEPATAALMPAARVSPVGVMVMSGSWSWVPGGGAGRQSGR